MNRRLFAVAVLFAALAVPAAAQQRKLVPHAFPIAVPKNLAAMIDDAARTHDLDPNLIAAMAFKESRYNPNAVSRLGAEGIMQLKPKTARYLGVQDSFDAHQNILGGAKYLRKLLDRFGGNVDMALAGYNAGPDLVARVGPNATAEAVEYVATVKRYYNAALRAQ